MTLQKLAPFVVFGLVAMPGEALAHMVETNYVLDQLAQSEQVLNMQSTFSNGVPVKGAKVSVYSPNNPVTPWSKGVTDHEGRYSFRPDQRLTGDWEVVIQQQGHSDILTVPVDDTGVTPELISDRDNTDIHYADTSYLGWGLSLAALLPLGLWRLLQKRRG